jgi:hypothetical protein
MGPDRWWSVTAYARPPGTASGKKISTTSSPTCSRAALGPCGRSTAASWPSPGPSVTRTVAEPQRCTQPSGGVAPASTGGQDSSATAVIVPRARTPA